MTEDADPTITTPTTQSAVTRIIIQAAFERWGMTPPGARLDLPCELLGELLLAVEAARLVIVLPW